MLTQNDMQVETLGERRFRSPLQFSTVRGDGVGNFTYPDARVLRDIIYDSAEQEISRLAYEKAGPYEDIYFDPLKTKAAIVTCGGLCPGLNNVIRSLVLSLTYNYQVHDIIGFQYGYKGMNPTNGYYPIELDADHVEDINNQGGTILGSSRGQEENEVIVNTLEKQSVNILFCIGGDGTLRAAKEIHEEIQKRGRKIAVIGIPKTIDNDISHIWQTFGLNTAVEKATEIIDSAHNEAKGAPNGIGLIKLMGRDSGFISVDSTLASTEVNFCLIPEVPFDLYGKGAFLEVLEERIVDSGHAVIVVSEGAGQHLFNDEIVVRDASGNVKHQDIGLLLKDEITHYFKERNLPLNLKYFDPSYYIRSVQANASDSIFCDRLARHAVHAGMAGKSNMVVGLWHNVFTYVPIGLAVSARKKVDPESALWMSLLSGTGQPWNLRSKDE